ncbi:DUF6371 domain-containing protein [Spirosoma aerolatum]|uniref:DUF6371 domain-containing protein n=1 Tax=Spirosoma aerolatum TaxID=1211326 RepID=UPI0012D37129|nr:DUF6371 domain-containing protein [Spirosoma aerolatum]
MYNTSIDTLEQQHGTAILSELCGEPLTRNQQSVRLLDQTKHSAEVYFSADQQGKPYIQDFQNGKRYYPVTAYSLFYNLDFNTAKAQLIQEYYGDTAVDKPKPRPVQVAIAPQPVDYIPIEYYQRCQTHFEHNGLYEYLSFTYGLQAAQEVFSRYRLGTSRRWQYYGYQATCLPQFDYAYRLCQIKIIVFDAMSGRRVKNHQQALEWDVKAKRYKPTEPFTDKSKIVGRFLPCYSKANRPNLQQCFFGEHLLTEYPNKAVAIVEGESTAIVCSIIWPQYIWLATGGSTGGSWYSPERFRVLRGRNVTLWPDTGKYDDWCQKAEALRPLVQSLHVTDYVEKNAPASMTNIDLRDLLTRPCYFPADSDQIIYGEVLANEPNNTYPAEWDATLKPIINHEKSPQITHL